jgi:hypothetical protein
VRSSFLPFSAVMAATNRTYKLAAPTPDRGSRRRDPIGLGSILMRY